MIWVSRKLLETTCIVIDAIKIKLWICQDFIVITMSVLQKLYEILMIVCCNSESHRFKSFFFSSGRNKNDFSLRLCWIFTASGCRINTFPVMSSTHFFFLNFTVFPVFLILFSLSLNNKTNTCRNWRKYCRFSALFFCFSVLEAETTLTGCHWIPSPGPPSAHIRWLNQTEPPHHLLVL